MTSQEAQTGTGLLGRVAGRSTSGEGSGASRGPSAMQPVRSVSVIRRQGAVVAASSEIDFGRLNLQSVAPPPVSRPWRCEMRALEIAGG